MDGQRVFPLLITFLVLLLFSLSGCLSRSSGPTLPYVKPAQSVPPVDPLSIRSASRLDQLEVELQRLRDMIERLQAEAGSEKVIKNLQDRVAVIERQLGIDSQKTAAVEGRPPQSQEVFRDLPKQPARHSGSGQEAVRDQVGAPIEIQNAPVSPDEKIFREAHSLYKNGSFDQAIIQFEELLKKFPQSQLASDAIYWIGESRFAQGRFDEAVLQFDRVLKEFPGSPKELSALLRQGQAFEKMGDIKSARIIYQKLVSEHPHTAQGRIAGGKLKNTATQ